MKEFIFNKKDYSTYQDFYKDIAIKNLTNLKFIDDLDEPVPIGWILDCLNDDDKLDAITYLLKKSNII